MRVLILPFGDLSASSFESTGENIPFLSDPSLLASQWIGSFVQTVYISPAEFITQPGPSAINYSKANNLSLGGWAWHKHLYLARGWPGAGLFPAALGAERD